MLRSHFQIRTKGPLLAVVKEADGSEDGPGFPDKHGFQCIELSLQHSEQSDWALYIFNLSILILKKISLPELGTMHNFHLSSVLGV